MPGWGHAFKEGLVKIGIHAIEGEHHSPCPQCKGSGRNALSKKVAGPPSPCKYCKGKGKIKLELC